MPRVSVCPACPIAEDVQVKQMQYVWHVVKGSIWMLNKYAKHVLHSVWLAPLWDAVNVN